MMKDPNVYPPGLNAKKVQEIIGYYENQTNEDAATEIERVHSGYAMVEVPKELVRPIEQLVEEYLEAKRKARRKRPLSTEVKH